MLVPIGGGGLSAGVCVAVKALRPDARVIGVEPELAADAADSLREGRIVRWGPELTGRTIADGMRTSALGRIPFAHLQRLLDGVLTVSEDDIRWPCSRPPRGRASSPSRRARRPSPPGCDTGAAAGRGHVVLVVSGGNVDAELYRSSWRRPRRWRRPAADRAGRARHTATVRPEVG